MTRYIVGIDPGKKGAIAFLAKDFSQAQVYPMPEFEEDLINLLAVNKDKILYVAIEKQQPFPEQGISSTFKLGKHYGILLGILKTLEIPFEEIPPQRWRKAILGSCKGKRKILKKLSLEKARNLFPEINIGKNDGKADALLLAEYARRTLFNQFKLKYQKSGGNDEK